MPDRGAVERYSVTAVAVMVAWGESFQVFGSLNSSPWTARNFGADPAKAASMRSYVRKAVLNNALMGGLGSWLLYAAGEDQWWLPFAVTSAISGYMFYEYESALQAGAASGSTGWSNA